MNRIEQSVLHGDDGLFMGKITIYSDGIKCYSQFSGTKRLTRADAIADAEWMQNDLLSVNGKA